MQHSHTLQNAFCLAINLTLEAEVNCFVRGISVLTFVFLSHSHQSVSHLPWYMSWMPVDIHVGRQ